MVRFNELRSRLDREPFRPFIIRVEDGRGFKVLRRNLCILTRHAAYVGVPDSKDPRYVRRMDYCPFDYATGIEELKASDNGSAGRTRGKRGGKSAARKTR